MSGELPGVVMGEIDVVWAQDGLVAASKIPGVLSISSAAMAHPQSASDCRKHDGEETMFSSIS